jgi:hypothetical protein
MNQLKIDISFNHNDAVRIHSDELIDFTPVINENDFFHLKFFDCKINTDEVFEEVEFKVPIKFTLNGEEFSKNILMKSKCQTENLKDASENDISKNILHLEFDESVAFKGGDLKKYLEKIPNDILENNDNLLELDLESDDLPVDVKEWKENYYTFKPFMEFKLKTVNLLEPNENDGLYFYVWLSNFGYNIKGNCKFDYKFFCYYGKKLDFKKINIQKIIMLVGMRKNLEKNLKVDVKELFKI